MKSALDCFNHATRCEEMACAINDIADRQMLLETAEIWRELGKASNEAEAGCYPFIARRSAKEA
jgi:hypothetical protein